MHTITSSSNLLCFAVPVIDEAAERLDLDQIVIVILTLMVCEMAYSLRAFETVSNKYRCSSIHS